jgi:hypothetical protein
MLQGCQKVGTRKRRKDQAFLPTPSSMVSENCHQLTNGKGSWKQKVLFLWQLTAW